MARPIDRLTGFAEQAYLISTKKENVKPGFESLATQKAQSFLEAVNALHLKALLVEKLTDADKQLVQLNFLALAQTLVSPEDFINAFEWVKRLLVEIESFADETATEDLSEKLTVSETTSANESGSTSKEKISNEVDYFSRFIAQVRSVHKQSDFLAEIFPNAGPENAAEIAERLKPENMTPEIRRDALRQIYLVLHFLYNNHPKNLANTSAGQGAVFGSVKFPTEAVFTEENIIEVSGDPELNRSRDMNGVIQRFPPPFRDFLTGDTVNFFHALTASTGAAAAIYGQYKSGRMFAKDYIPFVTKQNTPLNHYTLRYFVGNEVAANKFAEDPQSGLEMAQDWIHGDLIRYAQSLLDTLYLGGKVPKDVAGTLKMVSETEYIFDIVKEKCVTAYERKLGRKLKTLEIEFVDACVRWAYTARRLSGSEYLYDRNSINAEVSQLFCAREYHPKKNIEANIETASAGQEVSGSKYYTKELWMIMRRAAVPEDYATFITVRLPQDAVEVTTPDKYFDQLKRRYPNDPNKHTEVINAFALLTPDMRKDGQAALDYSKLAKHLVAVRVKDKRFRALDIDDIDAEYILLPKSHIVGHPSSDGIDGRYTGLTVNLQALNHLNVKYFDDTTDSGHKKKYYDGVSTEEEAELRRLIVWESLTESPGVFYGNYFQNALDALYETANVKEPRGFDIRKVKLVVARYPESSTFETIFGAQPFQQGREFLARQPLAPGYLQTLRTGFDANKHINPRIHSMVETMSIESGVDSALGDKDSPLNTLFNTQLKYVLDNLISLNPEMIIDPITGKGYKAKLGTTSSRIGENGKIDGKRIVGRSLLPLRLMFGDRLELDESNKPYHPERFPWSPSTFSPKKLTKFIDAWENAGKAVGLEDVGDDLVSESKADSINLLGVRIEMLFSVLDLYLSKYKMRPLPENSRLADYRSYIVQTVAGDQFEPLNPLDTMKLRTLVSRLIYNVVIGAVPRDQSGGMTLVRKFLERNHYTEKEIHERLDIIMRNYGIIDSFEAAVVALKFEHGDYKKLPSGHDIQKKPEEAPKK